MNLNLYVGFSATNSMLGKLIRAFTGGICNHAFLLWQDVHLGWVTLGANGNGITLDTLENFKRTRTIIATVRPTNMSDLWPGLFHLRNQLNVSYDTSGLIGMGIVEIARAFHKNWSNPLDNSGELFCSEFAIEVIRAAGYNVLPGVRANVVDPQMLLAALARDDRFIGEPIAE